VNALAVAGGLIIWMAASLVAGVIWSSVASYFKHKKS
jgi:hypothetical protein